MKIDGQIKPKEPIRIDLDEEESRKFKELSERLGIKIKTDIFRFCLSFTYNVYLKKIAHE
jgi:hypothetical protein